MSEQQTKELTAAEKKVIARKKFKLELIGLFVSIGVLALIVVVSSMQVRSANSRVYELNDQISDLENRLAVGVKATTVEKSKLLYEATGLDATQINKDTQLAEEFFEPAFSWKNGEQYDNVRALYMSKLGDDSSFVTEYLSQNSKMDGYNKVDLNKLKTSFDKLMLYPLNSEGQLYQYMAVITYYIYQNEGDIKAKDSMRPSTAFVMFSVVNDDTSSESQKDDNALSERIIKDVKAYPGVSGINS